MKTGGSGPFILVQDNDSHWYVIPKAEEHAWHRWIESSDYADGETPIWAFAIGGSPSLISFETYSHE